MTELVLKEEVYEIVGAALEVYYRLGRGFLEPVYQEALQIELRCRAIPFEAQKELTICYKGYTLEKKYIPDFVCFGQIIAELKVSERLQGHEVAQLINYLKATGCRVGLLINFGSRVRLEWGVSSCRSSAPISCSFVYFRGSFLSFTQNKRSTNSH